MEDTFQKDIKLPISSNLQRERDKLSLITILTEETCVKTDTCGFGH